MSHIHTDTDNRRQVEEQSKAALPEHIVEYIERCRADEHPEGNLISVLHKVQAHFGHLGKESMDAVAQLLQVPIAKITGVATFYHFFRTTPKGKYLINVCLGTACYVQGAERIVARLKDELGIDFGETTNDGLFTLEGTRCIGTCGLAPVMTVNDKVHGKVNPDKIPLLIQGYIDEAKSGAASQ